MSRVINQSPFVKDETRERINAIIAETGFSPDPQARGLAFRRSFLIGLVYDNPNPQYVVNMQLGLLDAMRGSGYELVVHPCNRGNPTFLADFRRFIERQKLSGVVLTPSVSEDERAAKLRDSAARHETAATSLETHGLEVDGLKDGIAEVERRSRALTADGVLEDFEPPVPGHKDWLALNLPTGRGTD